MNNGIIHLLLMMKNLLLVVYVVDDDKSTINGFIGAAKRIKSHKTSREKIISLFIESLISDGNIVAEQLRDSLTDMEELIVNNTADKDFNVELLAIKKRILKYYNYYSQIMDMSEIIRIERSSFYIPCHYLPFLIYYFDKK